MNFFISFVGWFLWNWAEFSITKEKGEGSVFVDKVTTAINSTSLSDADKVLLISKTNAILGVKYTIKEYMLTHYETWIGSFVMIALLLWAMSRQLSLDPFAPILGTTGIPLGWNDIYLVLSGAAWDAFIFGFKWVKNFFKKKEKED